jgi:hypothetical protein
VETPMVETPMVETHTVTMAMHTQKDRVQQMVDFSMEIQLTVVLAVLVILAELVELAAAAATPNKYTA